MRRQAAGRMEEGDFRFETLTGKGRGFQVKRPPNPDPSPGREGFCQADGPEACNNSHSIKSAQHVKIGFSHMGNTKKRG